MSPPPIHTRDPSTYMWPQREGGHPSTITETPTVVPRLHSDLLKTVFHYAQVPFKIGFTTTDWKDLRNHELKKKYPSPRNRSPFPHSNPEPPAQKQGGYLLNRSIW